MKAILLRQGRVMDPAAGVNEIGDVLVRDGRIQAIGPDLLDLSDPRADVLDCTDRLVLPGLIDTHAHVYQHVTGRFGLNADLCGVHSGVTTLIDQGGASCMTLPGFRHYVVETARTHVYAFLSAYLVGGLEGHFYPELYRPECLDVGATVKAAPISERGELLVEQFIAMLTPEVKLACVTHVSNVLGTVNPVREIARECRKRGIALLVDGSQAVPHRPVDVQALGCDFYAFTGHKMLAPTGTGALWARREHLEAMPPFFGGGEMIREVRFSGTTFAAPPHKFEAGTPNIAGFVGLGAAIDYYQSVGFAAIHAWEQQLLAYATERLREIPGLRIIGEAPEKEPVISFLIDGAQASDLATLLDLQGVAVRSGHHCAHPLMQFYNVPATLRASFAFYNTREEIDAFIVALLKVRKLLM